MADGNILHPTFPPRLRVVESHPQVNSYGFPPVEEVRERVEITAGISQVYATRVDGVIWAEFQTATNAIRCAEHLRGLIALDALTPRQPEPPHEAA